MTGKKLIELDEAVTIGRDSLLYAVTDPDGSPIDNKITIPTMMSGLFGIIVAASDSPLAWKLFAKYVCDGDHDEEDIQNALDDLDSTYGGSVILSPGKFYLHKGGATTGAAYNMGYCILIDQAYGPVTVTGQGIGSTICYMVDEQEYPCAMFLIRGVDLSTKRADYTTIRNIELDGNQANQSVWGGEGALIQTAYADNVTLEYVYPHNSGNMGCQVLRDSQNFIARNCKFVIDSDRSTAGLRIESPKSQIANCNFFGNNSYPYPPFQCVTNADVGIQSSDVQVVGCTFDTGRSLAVIAGNRISFIGCSFINATYSSAWAVTIAAAAGLGVDYNTDDAKLIGCSFYNIRQGILINPSGSCKIRAVRITDCTFREGPTISLANGVVINNTNVENAHVTGCTFVSATNAIVDNGTDTTTDNNDIIP